MRIKQAIILVLFLNGICLGSSLKSSKEIDIDGDGQSERFEYDLSATDSSSYQEEVHVISGQKELWTSEGSISATDLQEKIAEQGCHSKEEWVHQFFDKKLDEKEVLSWGKLNESSLKHLGLPEGPPNVGLQEVKKAILSENRNFLFTYQQGWGGSPWRLVYVPKFKCFASY